MASKSKTTMKVPPGIAAASAMAAQTEVAPVAQEPIVAQYELEMTVAEMANLVPNSPGQTENRVVGQVVTSPPLMPSKEALQAAASFATFHQGTYGAEKATMSTDLGDARINQAFQDSLSQIGDALNHQQIVRSGPTNVNQGGANMVMPSDVRDIPASLYVYRDQYRNHHYVREKADKLLSGLFGGKVEYVDPTNPTQEGLAGSIAIVASSRGFNRDPLVWVSQKLWESNNFEKEHKFDEMQSPEFNQLLDEHEGSQLLAAMRQCFNAKDVRDMSKLARYHNKSILAILRKIMIDEMIAHKMPIQHTKAEKKND